MKKKYFLFSLFLLGSLMSAQEVSVSIPSNLSVCNPGDCTSLNVVFPNIKETTTYQVSTIPYNPPFGSASGSTSNLIIDDRWSGVIDLKGVTPQNFNFCFYGQVYDKVLISTNGAITFSVAGIVPGGLYSPDTGSTWIASGPLPYSGAAANAPFKNSINGVFQDLNPNVNNSFAQPQINYYTIGAYPNRAFVVNFSHIAQYSCSSDASVGAQTSQIILYETTNVIDVYVNRREPCVSWANGNGLIGIQNQSGTVASFPSGRNLGTWSATNEAWRFTPSGNNIAPSIAWLKNGNPYGSGSPISICPAGTEQYTVTVSYPSCNGTSHNVSASTTVTVEAPIQAQEPDDLRICSSQAGPFSFDLTSNSTLMVSTLNSPDDYEVSYYLTLIDAQNGVDSIVNPQTFLSLGNQTIYAKVESLMTFCSVVRSFDLIVSPTPSAPSGLTSQTFTNGETLSNLDVTGTNIQWYGSATGNDLLPNTTSLVDNTTYYASQTNSDGCESRTNPSRLAVTAHLVLNNQDFNFSGLNVYPNPVKDVMYLSYSTEISSVEVYNMLGQKVLAKTLNVAQGQIDMSNLNAGNYIVKVAAEGLTKSIKVVKQ